ncbi:hypothetical protein OQY15_16575 [Pedobacter sp. MC2016-15]|uniref:hypothetical protein n=1 Tax=Pedobacter sp. MC2016-15 TaxID=2994473 RepID=UPI00224808AB|nr:hypothetical protein [Pedobacter sp. MC2016-15]MCX2480723.1 hypothetical protein [Pedobacter sp. MC2016-15]
MNQKLLLTLFISACLFVACGDKDREKQLDAREQAIAKQETDFAAKAADYQSLIKMRDSLRSKKPDTLALQQWPEGIPGNWNGKTLCRESDCTDYVVGDQRSDTWVFEGDSTGIFMKVINKDKILRVYNAQVDSTEIRLHYKTDSTATRQVDISVVLNRAGNDLMKGSQTISVNNSCTAKFSVELTRNSNP